MATHSQTFTQQANVLLCSLLNPHRSDKNTITNSYEKLVTIHSDLKSGQQGAVENLGNL